MDYNSRYDAFLAKKYAPRDETGALSVTDESGPIGAGVAQRDWLGNSNLTQNKGLEPVEQVPMQSSSPATGAAAAGKTLAQGGAPEDAVSQGLMMSGNPYAMGAGMALQTASSINKAKNARERQKYEDEVERVNMRQSAINKLAQIGQGLKA